jgi:hypothetical protein
MAEINLGVITDNPTRRSDSVGGTDRVDTFSFRVLANRSDINLALTGMNANANLRVYRDFNGNGKIDSNDRLLASSTLGSNNDESINLSSSLLNAGPGNYIAEIVPIGNASTRYDLRVATSARTSNTPDPSPLLPAEINVGNLTSPRSFTDTLRDNDMVDTYRFNVTSTRTHNFSARASGSVISNVDLILIRDGNGNRQIDPGEVVARSFNLNGTEGISRTLSAGTYYLQVQNLGSNTNYTLNMS